MTRTTIVVVLLLFGRGCGGDAGVLPEDYSGSSRMKIDHFMYAVANLDEGMAWAEEVFGVAPAFGGSHEGLGTRNALLSLGDMYLEIIAPDPAQSVESQMVTGMATMSAGGLVTWAAQGDLVVTKGLLEEAGISSVGPVETRRRTADGGLLVWDLLFPQGGGYGMPFFIDWRESPHPATTTPVGGELVSFGISTPDAGDLGAVLAGLGLDVEVSEGEPGMSVVIEGAKGPVVLAATEESRRLQPSSRR
ncbi:MAG: VOC family protein [Holophagales bacterium]|nr:VOC family protein [Holophagales bacterium]MYG30921.1 VOC family protein [Holophagales bacterium]MYI80340.1 VOC family protein [Holophagales bacterium]